ncbi:methyl-accepting chemotaxis protein [Shewanella khirikhana]|uniref:methyl-accepting chemotaxis protein n=1 Tax=Shewanella khirikhana TaxID=1965282 RepID=UPI0030D24277
MLLFLTVKQRILLIVSLPLLVFALVGAFVIFELGKLQHEIDEMFEQRVIPMHEISMVKNDLVVTIPKLVYSNFSGKLASYDLKAELDRTLAHSMSEWHKYRALDHGPLENQMIVAISPDIEAFSNFLSELKDSINGQPVSKSQIDSLFALSKPLSDQFKGLMEKQLEMSRELKQQGDKNAQLSRQIIIGSVVGMIFLLGVIGIVVFRSINKSLTELGNTISHITKSADLTVRVRLEGTDELAKIGEAFNAMVAKLQNLVNNILSGVMTLSSASEEMSAISNMMAATSEQQSQQTTLIASAVTEMNAAIHEVSQNAVSTSSRAGDVETLTREGTTAIRESIDSVNVLATTVLTNGKLIQDLNQQSNEINQVVLMIRGVAEQTNLLALNAAIEAARAGDSGRGFAVVADEVRQLAHDTQKATESISEMIGRLQSMSERAVKEMADAEQSAQSSMEKAEKSSAIISQIQAQMNEIVLMNAQVSSATEEQSTVIAEITQSITEFHESIAAVTENAQQNALASSDLANLGASLKGEVEQFVV